MMGRVHHALLKFGQTTSLKGISRSVKSSHKCLRSLWVVAFLIGMVAGVYQLSSVIRLYLSRPVVTDIKDGEEGSAVFPDITLCNINPVSNEKKDILTFFGYIQSLSTLFSSDNYNNLMSGTFDANYDDYFDFPPLQNLNITKFSLNLTANQEEELKSNLLSVAGYFQNLPKDQHFNASKADFILKCTFHRWDWSMMDIDCVETADLVTINMIPDYFACHTIRLPDRLKKVIRGVSIVLHLDDFLDMVLPGESYFDANLLHSKAVGARLTIHPPGTLPNTKEGITMSPGQETTVRLSHTKRILLEEPFSNCSHIELLDNTTQSLNQSRNETMQNTYASVYEKGICQEICIQDEILKACGCIAPYLAHVNRHYQDERGFCGYLNGTLIENASNSSDSWPEDIIEKDDKQRYQIKFTEDNIQKTLMKMECAFTAMSETKRSQLCSDECPTQCETNVYDAKLSQSPWPKIGYHLAFYNKFIANKTYDYKYKYNYAPILARSQMPGQSENENVKLMLAEEKWLISDNFLQLNILMEKNEALILQDQEKITWESLFGSVGGLMNLWIGITFFTFVELIELLLTVFPGQPKQETNSGTKDKHISNNMTQVHPFKVTD